MIAFSAPDDFKFMHLEKIYIRPVDRTRPRRGRSSAARSTRCAHRRRGGGGGDRRHRDAFWSANGDTIYFNTGFHATTQFFAVSTATGDVKQLTDLKGRPPIARDARPEDHHHLHRSEDAAVDVHRRVAARRRRPVEVDAAHRSEPVGQAAKSRSATKKRSPGSRPTVAW